MHADGHVLRTVLDRLIDGVDVQIDQLVRVLAAPAYDTSVRGVAPHRQRYFVELDVTTPAGSEVGNLLTEDGGGVVQQLLAAGVDASRQDAIAGKEVGDRRGRQRRLDRLRRHPAGACKVLRSQRFAPPELGGYFRFLDQWRERIFGQPDRKVALDHFRTEAFDFVIEELTPSALSIFPVRDDVYSGPLLHGDRVRDAFVLDSDETLGGQRPGLMLLAGEHQSLRTRQAANVFSAERRFHGPPSLSTK